MGSERKRRIVSLLAYRHLKRCTSAGILNPKGKYFKCKTCGKIGYGDTVKWPLKHLEKHGIRWWEDMPKEYRVAIPISNKSKRSLQSVRTTQRKQRHN